MKEKRLHTAVATYLKLQYPNVVFMSESSGLRTSIGVAKQLKAQRSKHKLPDMVILEPRGGYFGLVLELKVEDPFKKDGTLKKGRAEEQWQTLRLLQDKGYRCSFGLNFDNTKRIIDEYMGFSRIASVFRP